MDKTPAAKKSLGQHWLHDRPTLAAMCEAADVTPGDTVLEIGPGLGTLTAELLRRGAAVTAVELDERLGAELLKRFAGQSFRLQQQSIFAFDLTTLSPGYKIVANIPYYLTNHLMRLLAETSNPPVIAALLVQKEVAERLAAAPGGMSLLSVSVQLYYQVELGRRVPSKLFTPPPKVDSQVVILRHRSQPLLPIDDTKLFFQIARAGFAARRKTLLNSLSAGMRLDKVITERWLARAGIDSQQRPQALSMEQWYVLYRAYSDVKKS